MKKTSRIAKTKVIGFFGGSFNPPHLGHILAAVYAQHMFALDEIWFAPVVEHAFKKKLLPFADRMHLCKLALGNLNSAYKVTNVESLSHAEGKTLLTLRYLAQKYPHYQFKLLIGSDQWKIRRTWHMFSQIVKEFGVHVIPRGQGLGNTSFGIPDISSTYIRSHPRAKVTQTWVAPNVLKHYLKLV